MGRKSASDLVTLIGNMAADVQERAISEAREGIGRELADLVSSRNAEADVLLMLDDKMPEQLRDMRSRFEHDGVSSDFLAGILYAATLVADPTYDY